MKVKELIKKLSRFDQESDVFYHVEEMEDSNYRCAACLIRRVERETKINHFGCSPDDIKDHRVRNGILIK